MPGDASGTWRIPDRRARSWSPKQALRRTLNRHLWTRCSCCWHYFWEVGDAHALTAAAVAVVLVRSSCRWCGGWPLRTSMVVVGDSPWIFPRPTLGRGPEPIRHPAPESLVTPTATRRRSTRLRSVSLADKPISRDSAGTPSALQRAAAGRQLARSGCIRCTLPVHPAGVRSRHGAGIVRADSALDGVVAVTAARGGAQPRMVRVSSAIASLKSRRWCSTARASQS